MTLSYTLITDLIKDNKIELIEELLAAGLSLEPNSYNPLLKTISNKNPKLAEIFINAGCNLNFQNGDGETPLMEALYFRQAEIAKLLINAGANIGLKDKDGNTALVYAIAENLPQLADLIRSRENELKLINACESLYCQDQLIRDLLATGVNVNAVDYDGYSALMCAADKGNRSQIKLLIEAGADINLQTRVAGKTALIFAINRQISKDEVTETIKDLLAAGADPDIKNHNGETAHDLAIEFANMYPNNQGLKKLVEILKLSQNKKMS